MSDITPWIEHLSDPLVLVGFAIFTLAGLVKLFKPEKLTGKATEGLFHKGLNFVFVLALLIVIGGFAKSIVQQQAAAPQAAIIQHSEGKQSPNSVGAGVAAERIEQGSKGDQSPNSVGNATVSVQK
ncbi:MAG: hypothetical protein BWK73_21305 [Thiothrix lacustris]|uniref:Uncharacterized protein n=1 Tax=Thiothrix lacustris TaxID=525917 RepID=A0A1Y1QNH6_9GAMM|nr:MAG: hypothetical protein BWK73_21305 [Thiothrix lacustris]